MNKAWAVAAGRASRWRPVLGGGAAAQTIVVGGKAFTEQQIMTAMTVALLKAKGFTPDRKAGMGSAAVRAALENGQIDVYWEYTGTGARRLQQDHRQVRLGRRRLQEDQGGRRARRASSGSTCRAVNNTYGVRDEPGRRAEARHRHDERPRQGDQGRRQAHVRVERRVLRAARRTARAGRPRTASSSSATTSSAWTPGSPTRRSRTGRSTPRVVFATDGRIPAFNFVVLKDDKNYAAPYNLTPVVRKEMLDKNPKLADALNALAAKLNDDNDGEAQRQRRRRQEDAGGRRRGLPQGATA